MVSHMGFPANFTAIDFETANRRRDSACQLGAVVVEAGKIVREQVWMIRPDPFFFSPGNIRVHGIQPKDVENENDFAGCWQSIRQFLGDGCLIAHNASFDLGVLLGCLQRHQIPIPDLQFSCTRLIAKQTWPQRPRFGLKPLSTWLGVEFRHHDALEDARACAKILLAAGLAKDADSLENLESTLRIVRGKAGDWGISQASRVGRKSGRKSSVQRKGLAKRALRKTPPRLPVPPMNPFEEPSHTRETSASYLRIDLQERQLSQQPMPAEMDWQRLCVRAELIQPLRGKRILVSGRLRILSKDQFTQLAEKAGAECQSTMDDATNFVVVGAEDNQPGLTEKMTTRETLEWMTESEFLERLGVSSGRS
ncbi:MAG: exonuclease domain-containing protein [Planctomycetota bacterium]